MSTNKPVTIPREVADAIEYLRTDEGDGVTYSNERIALIYADTTYSGGTTTILRKIPFDTLMRALLDGYERELTEEEKREQAYASILASYVHHEDEAHEDYSCGYCDGVEETLEALGVKVPGVNAPEGGAA
ncbi:hypothetical protein [Paenibacillus sp. B-A-8]|uniref:hypothetical protein n=1 Tax=Paenibacillus sp. B-A-8 TaxID=3400419 RepID=UPI003B013100